jgi:hypothetical protein
MVTARSLFCTIGYSYRNQMNAVLFTGPNTFATAPREHGDLVPDEQHDAGHDVQHPVDRGGLLNQTWAVHLPRAGRSHPAPTSLACSLAEAEQAGRRPADLPVHLARVHQVRRPAAAW